MYAKFLATLMVLRLVSNEDHVILHYFFPQVLNTKSVAYIEVLGIIVKTGIDSLCNGKSYVF